jgi:low affinity Fe/Cu permease
MKKVIQIILLSLFISNNNYANNGDEEIYKILDSLVQKQKLISENLQRKFFDTKKSIDKIQVKLLTAVIDSEKLQLLIDKEILEEEFKKEQNNSGIEISKLRYVKGLQIIKLLYDKILSLDHHFSTVKTFSEISKIANPNNYPEFGKVKDILKSQKEKKSFDISGLLNGNIIATAIQTFQSLLTSSLNKSEKEDELKKIECILDFSLRMNTDLNNIYFETSFLSLNNDEMKKDIEILYKDFTKPVNYLVSLTECRNNDDWDAVKEKLDEYLKKIETLNDNQKKHKMQIELEFCIDRLLNFITKYNKFIDDCTHFYQKFKVVLNSYENEKQCDSKLPLEFKKLKDDVDNAIQKFSIAYKPIEINGSKLKEILYGINEYD